MNAQSPTSHQKSVADTLNAIFSQGSLAGHSRCKSPDGRPMRQSGRDRRRASLLAAQVEKSDSTILAPAFLDLIAECRPQFVFGEQVAAAISQHWLDFIFADLEAEGYACGASVLAACSVGAPHLRSRIMFGAVVDSFVEQHSELLSGLVEGYSPKKCGETTKSSGLCGNYRLANSTGNGNNEGNHCANEFGRQRQAEQNRLGSSTGSPIEVNGFWRDADWLFCREGKWRPVEPGTFPLANGIPTRMGSMQPELRRLVNRNRKSRLRGYGNAIVPQVAAEFITAFLDSVKIIKNNYCVIK